MFDRPTPSANNMLSNVQDVVNSPGRPLDAATRQQYEGWFGRVTEPTQPPPPDGPVRRIGAPAEPAEAAADALAGRALRSAPATSATPVSPVDFSRVRVHTDDRAAESSRRIGAAAYTVGQHIVLRNDRLPAAQPVLAHELAHTLLGTTGDHGVVRRRIEPENVSTEMAGSRMTVTAAFTGARVPVPAGTVVQVLSWDNALPTVHVLVPATPPAAATQADIPKRLLQPVTTPVAGIAPYSAGVAAQAQSVERGQAAIAAEQARPGGPRPGELTRLTGLQQTRERLLNRRLIQARMFNRFDASIARWTAFYNAQAIAPARDPLDPNLVKSLLFQESQLGTAGQHLEDPPSHPVKTRFNLGQAIDSSGLILLTMMAEIDPALLTTFHLTSLRTDLAAAQSELATLRALTTPTPAQQARLAQLVNLSGQNWEVFIWTYHAAGQTQGFNDAVTRLFAPPAAGPARNVDYDFWIRTAIRWLFEKRRSVRTWDEAIRAYNGSGAAAQHYRDAVRQRADAATAAAGSGTEFVPAGI